MTVEKPKMYHVEHFLKDADTLPKEALAIVSDSDLVAYENEFDVYQKQQQTVVQEVSTLSTEAKERIEVIFGRRSKQYKYIERAIYNGEALADLHNKLFPKPHKVREAVETAKLRCPNIGKASSVGGRSNESIEEINTAVAYLLGEDLKLNSEFTIGNAVEVAKARKSSQFHHSMIAEVGAEWLNGGSNNKVINHLNETMMQNCKEDDCEGNRYKAQDNVITCECGELNYKIHIGVMSDGTWGISAKSNDE